MLVVLVRASQAGRHVEPARLVALLLASDVAEHATVRVEGDDLLVVLWLSATRPRTAPPECAALVRNVLADLAVDCDVRSVTAGPVRRPGL